MPVNRRRSSLLRLSWASRKYLNAMQSPAASENPVAASARRCRSLIARPSMVLSCGSSLQHEHNRCPHELTLVVSSVHVLSLEICRAHSRGTRHMHAAESLMYVCSGEHLWSAM